MSNSKELAQMIFKPPNNVPLEHRSIQICADEGIDNDQDLFLYLTEVVFHGFKMLFPNKQFYEITQDNLEKMNRYLNATGMEMYLTGNDNTIHNIFHPNQRHKLKSIEVHFKNKSFENVGRHT